MKPYSFFQAGPYRITEFFLAGPERITEFILAGLGNDNGIYIGWLRKGQRNFVLAALGKDNGILYGWARKDNGINWPA